MIRISAGAANSVTRIENLSDIAFAVALGMIISGVDAPTTYPELIRFLIYIIPAGVCFAILLQVWNAHYTVFRRYGVADLKIIFYNALLIFLVLYLAYPLRFIFDSIFAWIIGTSTGDFSRYVEIGVMDFETSGSSLAVFAVIYGAVSINLALMFRYIRTKKEALDLNAYEMTQPNRDHAIGGCLRFYASLSRRQSGSRRLMALRGFSSVSPV